MKNFDSKKFVKSPGLPICTCEITNLYKIYKNTNTYERYTEDILRKDNKKNKDNKNKIYDNIQKQYKFINNKYSSRNILGLHLNINGVHSMPEGITTGLGRSGGGGNSWNGWEKLIMLLSYNTTHIDHKRLFTKTEVEKHRSVLNTDGRELALLFGEIIYNEYFSSQDKQKKHKNDDNENKKIEEAEKKAKEAEKKAKEAEKKAKEAEKKTEEAERNRKEAERKAIEQEKHRKEAEIKAKEAEKNRKEAEIKAIEEEKNRKEAEKKAIEEEKNRKEAERKAIEEEKNRKEIQQDLLEEKTNNDDLKSQVENKNKELDNKNEIINNLNIDNDLNNKNGGVYCIIDPTRPNMRKIGCTGLKENLFTKENVITNLKSQYTTRYCPKGIDIVHIELSTSYKKLEEAILSNKKLKQYRIEKTEWFEFDNLTSECINNLIKEQIIKQSDLI